MAKNILDFYLDSFADYFASDVSEVSINQPGEIWLARNGVYERHDFDVELRQLEDIPKLIADYSSQVYNDNNPLLSATLPTGERFQSIKYPAVKKINPNGSIEKTVAISIRRNVCPDKDLQILGREGYFDRVGLDKVSRSEVSEKVRTLLEQENPSSYQEALEISVKHRLNILISGGMGSGKTGLMNFLMKDFCPKERIITVEDNTPELILRNSPNHLRLFYSRGEAQSFVNVSKKSLIDGMKRLNPHRMIMGELRDDDGADWITLANAGHPGTIATIHANGTDEALEVLKDMVSMKYTRLNERELDKKVRRSVDVVVQVGFDAATNHRYAADIKVVNHEK